MTPTEELRNEHEGIRTMLRVLDRFAMAVEAGAPVQMEDGDSILDFLKIFVDRCHHAKEEEYLFPLLSKHELTREEKPVAAMLHDHREGRALVHAMADAFDLYRNGDAGAKGLFTQSARSYIDLLRPHIRKEEDLIFPAAERLLDEPASRTMMNGFDRIERERIGAGGHDSFHRLLKALKEKYVEPLQDLSPHTHTGAAAPLRQGEWYEDVGGRR